jgi:hypothetical protein
MWHFIAHLLGWNTGEVVTFYVGRKLMVGFRCDGCGKLYGVQELIFPPSLRQGEKDG